MRKKAARSEEKKFARKSVDWKALEIVHPDAAGIDVGGSEHWVAVSPERVTRKCWPLSSQPLPLGGGSMWPRWMERASAAERALSAAPAGAGVTFSVAVWWIVIPCAW